MLDDLGALDPAAVELVREQAWPQPESSEEVHDALSWMGFVTDEEAASWMPWLTDLAAQNRVVHADGRWSAVDGLTDPKTILLGRLEGLGPVFEDDPRIGLRGEEKTLLLELEHDGAISRTRLEGETAWCERRLLARIHRYTIDKLRREIEPVSAGEFLQFLACWQHVDAEFRLEGPRGVAEVLRNSPASKRGAGLGIAHSADRVRDYHREWLDEVTLSGEFAWGRLWGGAASAIRVTPISFVPREQLDDWLSLAAEPNADRRAVQPPTCSPLTADGPMFPQSLPKAAKLVPAHVEMGLADLLARGLVTCDSFAAISSNDHAPFARRHARQPVGRWCCFRSTPPEKNADDMTDLIARQLLRRTGVVFHRHAGAKDAHDLVGAAAGLSAHGTARRNPRRTVRRRLFGRAIRPAGGGRTSAPLARQGPRQPISTVAADPLYFEGILTPAESVSRELSVPVNGSTEIEAKGHQQKMVG